MDRLFKSSVEAMEDIRDVLVYGGIPEILTGELRLIQRKLGSKKEDVIINTLIYGANQVQTGIFNINIHVPNLSNQPASNPTTIDNTQPDIERMQEIAQKITPMVDDFYGADFSLHLHEAGQLLGYGTEWLFNIPVRYTYFRSDAA